MEESLRKHLEKWQLSSPLKVTSTSTSEIYRVATPDGSAILKLLTAVGVKDESGGALALRYFNGEGAVKLLQSDSSAQLLEYVEGHNLLPLIQSGKADEALTILSDVLAALHQPKELPLPNGLHALDRWFRSLLMKAESPGCRPDFLDAASIAKEVLATPVHVGILHGDIHHENVLFSPSRGWLSIDPKGLVGEITFDTANIFFNPVGDTTRADRRRIEYIAKTFAERLNLDYKRILMFGVAYGFLSASWMIEDGQNPSPTIKIASRIRTLI